MTTEAQRKSRAKYNRDRARGRTVTFCPPDYELLEWAEAQPESFSGLCKRLLREASGIEQAPHAKHGPKPAQKPPARATVKCEEPGRKRTKLDWEAVQGMMDPGIRDALSRAFGEMEPQEEYSAYRAAHDAERGGDFEAEAIEQAAVKR